MKLSGVKAKSFIRDGKPAAVNLVFGENVLDARKTLKDLIKSALGETAQEEMRLTSLEAKEVQKDPALLNDACRSVSFFPGPQGVEIYGVTDVFAKTLELTLPDLDEQSAFIFIQAGNLKKNSKLRNLLEKRSDSVVIGLYDEPITPDVIKSLLTQNKVNLSSDAFLMLQAFAQSYDASALGSLIETLALYQGEAENLSADEVAAILPAQYSAAEDEIINAMFRGDAKTLVAELRRAPAQGISMAGLNMMAIWRAKMLFELFTNSNPSQAVNTMRPPLFGARRQAVEENLRRWTPRKLEAALETLSEAEKKIRSGKSFLPEQAYLERIFLRVAILAR